MTADDVGTVATKKRKSAAKRRRKRCVAPKRRARAKPRAKRSALDAYTPGVAVGEAEALAGVSSAAAKRKAAAKKRKRAQACRKPAKKKRKPAVKRVAPIAQPVPPPPAAPSAPVPPLTSPLAIYSGAFGRREAERLLWRAGFGPSPGHAEALAALGLDGAVRALTRPAGEPTLTGAEPTDGEGPLFPEDAWGHDHLWFLDRMVRTDQQLIERMTLIWHDWFATSGDAVDQRLMIGQNHTFRRNALGSFHTLVREITADPAMILWLNQNENSRWNPNENYARELQELFTLGADRGAYSEDDVRELARALTGWTSSWSAELGSHNFRFVANRHDAGVKTVFGRGGNWNWEDACRLCLENPLHPSFLVEKLWSYFIPEPPSAGDREALEQAYTSSGYQVRPLVEAILLHPRLHEGPRMVKPPVVALAGWLRALRRPIDTGAWNWLCEGAAQRLFHPPNVAGWDDDRWLDTSTLRGRWEMASYAVADRELQGPSLNEYDETETPEQAVRAARDFWGDPPLTPESVAALTAFATAAVAGPLAVWQRRTYRGLRQNALRVLVATCPDMQTS
jgi:hypothetical protein